ncbi:hypothetical protein B7P02_15750 [Bordetella bronchiseptica]|uniref:hypothetical protein n=1 Tax=Bordetella bronchiseptica TaxID=518 RepID=UPI000D735574|nr:hypothetical protein [Bordetella bronchiseptica]AWP59375.1 hypothetical protein B7P02_15750 [Bordetella bronchiseptica]
MQWDEDENTGLLEDLMPAGWTASRQVVSSHVQNTLQEAVRIANQSLDKPSEQAVMQLFQAMIVRTSFEDNSSITIH